MDTEETYPKEPSNAEKIRFLWEDRKERRRAIARRKKWVRWICQAAVASQVILGLALGYRELFGG